MITIIGPDWPSKRLLASAVAEVGGKDVVVPYGTTRPNTLNGMPRLNAIEQLRAMRDVGVNVPDFTEAHNEAVEWVRDGHLVFGRQLIRSQGRDIVGPGPRAPQRFNQRWWNSEWWSKVVKDVKEEWRIHIFRRPPNPRGESKYVSIARGVKHKVGEEWRKMPVRNRANGWHMKHDVDPPEQVREAARSAVKAVGYDFGAVDVLWTTQDEAVVLEVNSAPGLDDYTCGQYVKAIERWTI